MGRLSCVIQTARRNHGSFYKRGAGGTESERGRGSEDGRRTGSFRVKVVSEAQNSEEGILPRTFQNIAFCCNYDFNLFVRLIGELSTSSRPKEHICVV